VLDVSLPLMLVLIPPLEDSKGVKVKVHCHNKIRPLQVLEMMAKGRSVHPGADSSKQHQPHVLLSEPKL